MKPSVQDQTREIREVNSKNGWGGDYAPETIPRYLNLLHCEISETSWASRNKDVLEELSDVIIRALDLIELISPGRAGALYPYGPTLDDYPPGALPHAVDPQRLPRTVALLYLHGLVSRVTQDHRKVEPWGAAEAAILRGLADVAVYAVALMRATDRACSPSALVAAKVEKNKARGYRHGGLRT